VFRLDGKVALVTGAGQKIGAGTAKALAQQGATVIVNDYYLYRAVQIASEICASGGKARALAFDVTDLEGVKAAVANVAGKEGPVDILVANAGNAGVGGSMGMAPFKDIAPKDWQGPIAVNLYGLLNCVHAVLPAMLDRKWGRIICHTSGAGQRGLDIGVSLYGAAKSGQIGFMRHLAIETAAHGITCNTVGIGLVLENAEHVQHLADQIPARRLGKPSDIGAVDVFLASEEASWITGQIIGANGGSLMP
jgi:NAD(P)-dependent dehydrogenase (short-subunit alcohol dehydrogenase family)